ncbi:S-layer homology domain-containing protein [Metaplanococcus flavidus]|uniref:S-layer homology domain-containing protein n=1 Tax=Metaplanococcus flavidus TaxID=569883 RepID=A0ABW3LBE7_9BACL
MLVEAFKLKGTGSGIKAFTDVPSNEYFYPYVDALVHNGITDGTTKTTYSPYQNVSRVQMAVFISRSLEAENVIKGDAGAK